MSFFMAYAIIGLSDGIRHSYASKIRESCGRTGKENFSFYAIVVNFGKVKKSCPKHLTQVSGYNRISEVSI